MKIRIKHIDENSWKCIRCGLAFTLYGQNMNYIAPNFCPKCGISRINGTPSVNDVFEE